VRKGDGVSIPLGPMLRDNAVFPNPDVFDGFRFAKLHTKQPEGPTKFTDVNEKWQVWGVGKITW
jgi:cytochrome P450